MEQSPAATGQHTTGQDEIYYDIAAKAEGDAAPTKSEFRRMMQTLLVQRFNLKFHSATKEIPVYALTVSRSGSKLKASAPDASDAVLIGVHGRNQTMAMPRESMESLAIHISNTFMVDRPIVDRTGITGNYDIQRKQLQSSGSPRILSRKKSACLQQCRSSLVSNSYPQKPPCPFSSSTTLRIHQRIKYRSRTRIAPNRTIAT
jgi:uncharacterized protein (TIGR03435 family)